MGSRKSKTPKVQPTTTVTYTGEAPIAPTVQSPVTDVVTPAVARDLSYDARDAQQNQALARSRLNGVRSTWTSFGGAKGKLGS